MDTIWKKWIFSFVITAIAFVIMNALFPVHELIKLELAPDAASMQQYILNIHPDETKAYSILFRNTIADYFFLIGYSMLIYFSFRILLDLFDAPAGGWVWIISCLTGFFDVLEDNFLINSALRHQEDFSMLYYYIVRIKWAIAILPVMVIIIAIVYGLVLMTRARQPNETPAITDQ